jgi:hypothetical protein
MKRNLKFVFSYPKTVVPEPGGVYSLSDLEGRDPGFIFFLFNPAAILVPIP